MKKPKSLKPKGFKLAHIEGETSNKLLDTLAEWNEYLEKHVPYYQEPQESGQ